MRTPAITLITLLAALLAATAPASAQSEPRVFTQLASPRAFVGDSVMLNVVVDNATNTDPPRAPTVANLDITFANTSTQSSTTIVNGRRSERVRLIHSFAITPLEAGAYTIPAITVMVGGDQLRTEPVRLVAVDPPTDDRFDLVLEPARTTVYVGEPFTLGLTLLIGANSRNARFTLPIPDAFTEADAAPPPSPGRDPFNVMLNGRQVSGSVHAADRGNRQSQAFTVNRTLRPTRPGTYTIGPATAVFDVVVREGGFFDSDVSEPRTVAADPITIEVRPLPEEGQPPNFSGLVGRYDIQTMAEPTNVNIGDPITFRAVISGPEPLDNVPAPNLDRVESFAAGFKTSPDGWSVQRGSTPGVRVYTTTIRATSEKLTQVPPLELPHFDTDRGAYRVAASEPIPLTVRKTRQVTAADAVSASAAPTPIERLAIENAAAAAHANHLTLAALDDERAWTRGWLTEPGTVVCILLPPVAFGAIAATSIARRGRDPHAARRRAALARARAALARRAGSPESRAADAVRAYIAHRFDRADHAVTSFDARSLIRPIAPDLADPLAAALARVESPSAAEDGPPPDRVLGMLRTLDRTGDRP